MSNGPDNPLMFTESDKDLLLDTKVLIHLVSLSQNLILAYLDGSFQNDPWM
jgi:hypothetical protein